MIKKVFLVSIALLGAAMCFAQTATPPAKGDGTSAKPYEIATLENLCWLSKTDTLWGKGRYFVQTADIDASSTATWDNKAGFSPIGNATTKFAGNYDGQGWYISNLTINRPSSNSVGLFGNTVAATVKNVILTNCNIIGYASVGALGGEFAGSINKCASYGSVKGYSEVGGLIGKSSSATIQKSFSHAVVAGTANNIGGLIGWANSSNIYMCYARGNINNNWAVGGLVGYGLNSTFNQCYASGRITSTSQYGGLIGGYSGQPASILYSYWDVITTGCSTSSAAANSSNATGLATTDMKNYSKFYQWIFNSGADAWCLSTDDGYPGYPRLRWIAPNLVSSAPTTTYSSATTSTQLLDACGMTIVESGVCWSTSANPTIADNKLPLTGTPVFPSATVAQTISNLQANTVYHYRAYAISDRGRVYYYNDIAFATKEKAPAISYPKQYLHLAKDVKIDSIKPTNTGGAPQQMNVTTLIGNYGMSGNMVFDQLGNIYLTNRTLHTIMKRTPSGVITTIAGKGTQGTSNGNGTSAGFKTPFGITIAADGSLYVADQGNHAIRKITTNGDVTTFAGTIGSPGSKDGDKSIALFNNPIALKFDSRGNLFVLEWGGHRVRKIATDGTVTTIAGTGVVGSVDGAGSIAQFNYPYGLYIDKNDIIYVADAPNNKIRKISSDYSVSTIAGTGISGSTNGYALAATFGGPCDIFADKNNDMYIPDNGSHIIRKLSTTGTVISLAGVSGTSGTSNGIGSEAKFYNPTCVALDSIENLYIGDGSNFTIRKLTRYSIKPDLPAGLSFNTNTGEITGTPTAETAMTAYTIRCANTADSTKTTLYLATETPKLSVSTTNNGLAFDGVDDYLKAPLATNKTDNVTIETWVLWKGQNQQLQDQYIVINGTTTTGYGIYISSNGKLGGICSGVSYMPSYTTITANTWNHVALVRASGTWSLFLNGTPIKIDYNYKIPNIPTTMTIMGSPSTNSHFFNGSIDEVRIWNIDRPQDSIRANMYKSLSIRTDLVANYNFNQGVANGLNTGLDSLSDLSSTNKGTLYNFALTSNTSNWTTGAPIDYTTNPTTITLAKDIDTAYAEVTTNLAWTAKSETWLTLTQDQTKGSGVVKIIASANPTITERKATITISANGVASKTISVTQAAGDATLSVSTSAYTLAKEASKTPFTITSNDSCSIESSAPWLTATLKGLNGTLSAKANDTSISRLAIVTIKTTKGTPQQTKIITVNQAAGNTTLTAVDTVNIDSVGVAKRSISVTSNAVWTASDTPSWLTVTKVNGAIELTATNNTSVLPRIATITLKAKGEIDSIKKTIRVTQAAGAPTVQVSRTSIALAKDQTDTAKVTVSSNTQWEVTSNESWITTTSNKDTIRIKAEKNPRADVRSATLTVKTIGNPSVTKEINLTQAKADSTVAITETVYLEKSQGSRSAVKINANFDLPTITIGNNSGWYKKEIKNDSLIFTANTANPQTTQRDSSVTFKIGGISCTVNVIQLGSYAYLNNSHPTLTLTKESKTVYTTVDANIDWSITGITTWLQYKRMRNTQNDSIKFTIEANTTIKSRECILTIIPKAGNSQTIHITQAAGDTTLSLSRSAAEAKDTLHLNVFSNTAWNIASDKTWVQIDTLTGKNTAQRVLTVTKNNTVKARTAIITVKANGVNDATFTITQAAGDTVLNVQHDTVIAKSAATYSIPVKANIKWSASKKAAWLTLEQNTDSTKLNFSVIENKTIEKRFDTIILNAGTHFDTLFVTQAAADTVITITETAKYIEKNGATNTLTVTTNYANWTIGKTKQWITATKSDNNESMQLIVDENETIGERKDTIVLSAGTKTASIIITQEAGVERLSLSTESALTTESLTVAANTKWSVTENSEWLTVDTAAGKVTFKASANPTVNARSAEVIFKTKNGTVAKTLIVTQAAGAATLRITKQEVNFNTAGKASDSIVIKSNTTPTITTNNSSWITASIRDTFLIVTAQENTSSIARKDSFMVSVSGIEKYIVVTQVAADTLFRANNQNYTLAANVQLTKRVEIISNASLRVQTKANWLHVGFDGSSYKTKDSITITDSTLQSIWIAADTNKTAAMRKDTVTITSGTHQQIVVVQQDASIIIHQSNTINMVVGQPTIKLIFSEVFAYNGSGTIRYNVESSDAEVLCFANVSGGIKLLQGNTGTAIITLRASTSLGSSAEVQVTVKVESGACMEVHTQTDSPKCVGNKTGSIVVTPKTGTPPYYFSWSNKCVDSINNNLAAGFYAVTITDARSCAVVKAFTLASGDSLIVTPQITAAQCGGKAGAIDVVATGGTEPYIYSWKDYKDAQNSLQDLASGNYSLTVHDNKGCVTQKIITVPNLNAPVIELDKIIPSPCGKKTGAILTHIIGQYDSLRWSNNARTVNLINIGPGSDTLTVYEGECTATQAYEVPYTAMKQPQVALVTIDSAFEKPIVVWLRDKDTNAVAYYEIYRDDSLVARKNYRDYSVYHDTDASISLITEAYSYQIKAINACGVSTELSPAVSSMYLQAHKSEIVAGGVELQWKAYKSGLAINKYEIYRFNGSTKTLVAKVTNKDMYTDTTPGVKPRYYVVIDLNDTILVNQLKTDTGPFSQSFSNMSEALLVDIEEPNQNEEVSEVSLAPNPTNGEVSIKLDKVQAVTIKLRDLLGHQLLVSTTTAELVKIDCSGYTPGVYFVEVKTDSGVVTKRLVVK